MILSYDITTFTPTSLTSFPDGAIFISSKNSIGSKTISLLSEPLPSNNDIHTTARHLEQVVFVKFLENASFEFHKLKMKERKNFY